MKNDTKGRKKKNINGKVGINKYTPTTQLTCMLQETVCAKCGSVNHLAINCKNVISFIYGSSVHGNKTNDRKSFCSKFTKCLRTKLDKFDLVVPIRLKYV